MYIYQSHSTCIRTSCSDFYMDKYLRCGMKKFNFKQFLIHENLSDLSNFFIKPHAIQVNLFFPGLIVTLPRNGISIDKATLDFGQFEMF